MSLDKIQYQLQLAAYQPAPNWVELHEAFEKLLLVAHAARRSVDSPDYESFQELKVALKALETEENTGD